MTTAFFVSHSYKDLLFGGMGRLGLTQVPIELSDHRTKVEGRQAAC